MKKSMIFLSIIIIGLMAFVDAKDRLKELDSIAQSSTPAQREMQPLIPPAQYTRPSQIQTIGPPSAQQGQALHERMWQNTNILREKQQSIIERREKSRVIDIVRP